MLGGQLGAAAAGPLDVVGVKVQYSGSRTFSGLPPNIRVAEVWTGLRRDQHMLRAGDPHGAFMNVTRRIRALSH